MICPGLCSPSLLLFPSLLFSSFSNPLLLRWGVSLSLEDIWQCLETLLVATTGERGRGDVTCFYWVETRNNAKHATVFQSISEEPATNTGGAGVEKPWFFWIWGSVFFLQAPDHSLYALLHVFFFTESSELLLSPATTWSSSRLPLGPWQLHSLCWATLAFTVCPLYYCRLVSLQLLPLLPCTCLFHVGATVTFATLIQCQCVCMSVTRTCWWFSSFLNLKHLEWYIVGGHEVLKELSNWWKEWVNDKGNTYFGQKFQIAKCNISIPPTTCYLFLSSGSDCS